MGQQKQGGTAISETTYHPIWANNTFVVMGPSNILTWGTYVFLLDVCKPDMFSPINDHTCMSIRHWNVLPIPRMTCRVCHTTPTQRHDATYINNQLSTLHLLGLTFLVCATQGEYIPDNVDPKKCQWHSDYAITTPAFEKIIWKRIITLATIPYK